MEQVYSVELDVQVEASYSTTVLQVNSVALLQQEVLALGLPPQKTITKYNLAHGM
jgi:hypothetical protein